MPTQLSMVSRSLLRTVLVSLTSTWDLRSQYSYPWRVRIMQAHIAPEDSPATHPSRLVTDLPDTTIRVGSRELTCKARTASAPGHFRDWGSDPQATLCTSPEIPSGIVRIDIRTRFEQHTIAVQGQAVDYRAITP